MQTVSATEGEAIEHAESDISRRNKLLSDAFTRHGPEIFSWLRFRTDKVEDAEELSQTIYLELAKKRELDSITAIRAYLFQAARNALKNFQQRGHTRFSMLNDDLEKETIDQIVCKQPLQDDVTYNRQKLRLYESAVETLPPITKKVFLLVRFKGLSYTEASAEVEISERQIEYHMSIALRAIQAFVAPHME